MGVFRRRATTPCWCRGIERRAPSCGMGLRRLAGRSRLSLPRTAMRRNAPCRRMPNAFGPAAVRSNERSSSADVTQPPSDEVARQVIAALRRWSKRCARPVADALRTLCGGWTTDTRCGRDARACPWCRVDSGHRLAQARPLVGLRAAGCACVFGRLGSGGFASPKRRGHCGAYFWCEAHADSPPCTASGCGGCGFLRVPQRRRSTAPRPRAGSARARALFRRHSQLATQCLSAPGAASSAAAAVAFSCMCYCVCGSCFDLRLTLVRVCHYSQRSCFPSLPNHVKQVGAFVCAERI